MEKLTKTQISETLKSHRNISGFSVEEVAKKLKERGINIASNTLYNYENGVSMPNIHTFIALCDIYNISDIMSELGYKPPFSLAKEEWTYDEYTDFFNAPLLEKIYLLIEKGIPSFEGYEKQLENSLPSDAEAARYDQLWNLFSQLNEPAQEVAIEHLQDIKKMAASNHFKNDVTINELTTETELNLLRKYRQLDHEHKAAALNFIEFSLAQQHENPKQNTKNNAG